VIGILLNIFKTNAADAAIVGEGNEEPDGAGDAEEDGGEEKAVVVSKPGDRRRGGKSASGTSDFIEDMLVEMGGQTSYERRLRSNLRQWRPFSSAFRRFHRRHHMD